MKNWYSGLVNNAEFVEQMNVQFDNFEKELLAESIYSNIHDDLIKFSTLHNIDILPYLHVLYRTTSVIRQKFNTFYLLGLKKSGLIQDVNIYESIDYTIDLVKTDVVYIIAFIVALQHYFL